MGLDLFGLLCLGICAMWEMGQASSQVRDQLARQQCGEEDCGEFCSASVGEVIAQVELAKVRTPQGDECRVEMAVTKAGSNSSAVEVFAVPVAEPSKRARVAVGTVRYETEAQATRRMADQCQKFQQALRSSKPRSNHQLKQALQPVMAKD